MQPKISVYLTSAAGERFFGEGPYRLLCGVRERGSLRAAAQEMGMAYTKALRLLQCAEAELGFVLTRRTIGGRKGGGSKLTPEAEELLTRYAAYRQACTEQCETLFLRYFSELIER